jgi:hypothetical protein
LRYTNTALSTSEFDTNQNVIALIHQKNLEIKASQNINSIEIYDITGKLISATILKNKSREISENFLFAEGVYLIKIKLENGYLVTKKLINNKNP